MALVIKIGHPFDVNPELLEALRRPENVGPEEKFYALLGTFLHGQQQVNAPQNALMAALGQPDRSQQLIDMVSSGVHLAHLAGINPPKNQNTFFTNINELDVAKIEWGARLYKVIVDDEIAKQAWTIDRTVLMHAAKIDVDFEMADALRTKFGKKGMADIEDADEIMLLLKSGVEGLARLAAVDLKIVEAVRAKLWATYWGRGVAAPDIESTFKRFWDDVAPDFQVAREEANAENTAMMAEINKTDLNKVAHDIYVKAGVTKMRL